MFFDSHAHLDDEQFDQDREEVLRRLPEEGVSLFMDIGADLPSSRKAVELAQKYPYIYAAVGVHPHDAEEMTQADFEEIRELAQSKRVKAIGEIGLDYYYENSRREEQKKWFARQMELSQELNLPFVIHDRDAHRDCLEILRRFDLKKTGGVMHCYSGSAEMAKEIIRMGMVISIAGPVTFKNAVKTVEAVREIPLEYLLIETDSPYLAPVPHRGARNTPANVRFTAEKIAEIKGVSLEEVARITMDNAKKVFRIEE